MDVCLTVRFRREYSFGIKCVAASGQMSLRAARRFESMCEKIGQVFSFLEESRLYKFFMDALIYVRAE